METTSSRRRLLTGIGTVVIGSSIAGCTGGDGDGNTVEMTDDLVFDPAQLTVDVGDTVSFENVGSVAHTVTAYEGQIPDGAMYFASGGFDSEQAARDGYPDAGGIAEGESYLHTFETAGTYEYFCIPHESADMTGTITVQTE